MVAATNPDTNMTFKKNLKSFEGFKFLAKRKKVTPPPIQGKRTLNPSKGLVAQRIVTRHHPRNRDKAMDIFSLKKREKEGLSLRKNARKRNREIRGSPIDVLRYSGEVLIRPLLGGQIIGRIPKTTIKSLE